jgi:hypothetical protein
LALAKLEKSFDPDVQAKKLMDQWNISKEKKDLIDEKERLT